MLQPYPQGHGITGLGLLYCAQISDLNFAFFTASMRETLLGSSRSPITCFVVKKRDHRNSARPELLILNW